MLFKPKNEEDEVRSADAADWKAVSDLILRSDGKLFKDMV